MEDIALLIIIIAGFVFVFDDETIKFLKICWKKRMSNLQSWMQKKLK